MIVISSVYLKTEFRCKYFCSHRGSVFLPRNINSKTCDLVILGRDEKSINLMFSSVKMSYCVEVSSWNQNFVFLLGKFSATN